MEVKTILALAFLTVSIVCASDEHEKNHHAKHKSHHTNDHHAKRKTIFHHHLKHQSRDGNCRLVCDEGGNNSTDSGNISSSGNNNIQLVYNGLNELAAAVNVSENVASIIDYRNSISALLNGTSKSGVIINISSKKLFLLSNNNLLWVASKSSVEAYIYSQKSLSDLLKAAQENGEEIDDNNSIVPPLRATLGSPKVNTSQHLQELSEVNKWLNGTLNGLYKENGSVSVAGGLQRLKLITLGLGNLFSNVSGGLEGVLHGSKINVAEIFSASNALEVLLSVLKQIGVNSDLEKVLGTVLNNKDKLLDVLDLLTGGQTTELDGLLTLICDLRKSSDDLLDNVLNLLDSVKPVSVLLSEFVSLLQSLTAVIKEQQQKYGASSLINFEAIVSSYISGSANIGNVNLSDVVKVLQSDNISGGLDLTVKILISLGNANQSIPKLFQSVIKLVNGTDGAKVLSKLIPGINLNNPQQILQSVLKNTNLTEILSGGGNISAEITKVPVIGDIYSQISKSADGSIDLPSILNPSILQEILTNPALVLNTTGQSSGSSENGGGGSNGSGSSGVDVGGGVSVNGSNSVSGSIRGLKYHSLHHHHEKKHEKEHHKKHQKEHHKSHYKEHQKEYQH